MSNRKDGRGRDNRSVERWVSDISRKLGELAVKREALDSFKKTISSLAEWRGEQHKVAAERKGAAEMESVATTEARVAKAKADAGTHRKEAKKAEQEGKKEGVKADWLRKRRAELPPASRGSRGDAGMMATGDAVLLGIDQLVLRLALGLTPGSDFEHWATASVMGAGAVLIASILGWSAARATIAADGRIRRPQWPWILTIGLLAFLAVWFFVDLGSFRSEGLQKLSERHHLHVVDPRFFTIGQILFSAGSAFLSFSYFARRGGRELLYALLKAEKKQRSYEASALGHVVQAERAEDFAAQAPIRRDEAVARIYSLGQIAEAEGELEKKQGNYLEHLAEVLYEQAKAEVEVGVHYWRRRDAGDRRSLVRLLLGAGVVAAAVTLIAVVLGSGPLVTAIAAAGAAGLVIWLGGKGVRWRATAFKAKLNPTRMEGRSTYIVDLAPFAPNGHQESVSADELKEMVENA